MQKFFELVPSGTTFQFVKNRWRFITLSIVALVLTFASMAYQQVTTGSPLNFGIDFAGGSQVRLELAADKDPGIEQIRTTLEQLGYAGSSAVVVPEAEHEVLIRVKEVVSIDDATIEQCQAAVETVPAANDGGAQAKLIGFNHPAGGSKIYLKYDAEPKYREVDRLLNEAGCEGSGDKGFGGRADEFPVDYALIGIGTKLQEEFEQAFGDGAVTEIVRAETVGAKVGGQLKEDGAKSMLYAIGFIFLYVMIRFDLRFAPGGIVALIHDSLLVVGAFALTGKEFNLQTIAAILTVIGYSINDTIVVFDRVRERVALHRDEPLEETTNTALNDTLSRTILTSGTTLLVVVSVYVLGSGPIKDFAFALIIGMIVGTYSSLFIAAPIFLWVNRRFYAGKGHLQWLANKDREGTGALLGVGTDREPGEVGPSGAIDVSAEPPPEAEAEGGGPDDGQRKVTRRRRRRRPD